MTSCPEAEDPFHWVGAIIDGKYRIDGTVGEGGFAVVYKAHHLGLGEPVAIKCLKLPSTITDVEREKFLETFITEGRLLHQLSKSTSGIVQCLDVGAATSPNGTWTPFLVLEWLAGQTLHSALYDRARSGRIGRPLAEGVALLDSAARALATAHEQGVAHRDIKPANLFFAEVGGRATLKVVDFGIAKVLTEENYATTVVEAEGENPSTAFTPRYAAPEQFSRSYGPTGPWTDVFAFALVLVEVVSGRQALGGDDPPQIYLASCDLKKRPTLASVGISVSDDVEAILQRALSVDPRRRYATLGEMWDAILLAVPESSVARFSERPRAAALAPADDDLPHDPTTAKYADGSPSRPTANAKTANAVTASGRVARAGFARLVAAVALGAIGASVGFVFGAPKAHELAATATPPEPATATALSFSVTKAAPPASAARAAPAAVPASSARAR